MGIILLRLFYGIYFLGFGTILYHFFSHLLFSQKGLSRKEIFQLTVLMIFWPLAFFSHAGRQRLWRLKEKI